jgi:high-affinity iron transporter
MVASFLLALREGLEAALIVGVTLGVLAKMRRTAYTRAVWMGVAAASLASVAIAAGLQLVGAEFEGRGEEIFEGLTMLLAAGMLTWMIFWMQRQGARVQAGLEADVRQAAGRGQAWSLFGIAFVAVLREGIETALFLTAAAMTSSTRATLIGGLAGLLAAALLGWALFAATVRLNMRRFFQATGVLLILFAAGLVAHGVHEFNEAGLVPAVIEHVWNTNGILDENGGLGLLLKALFGYNGNPSLTEVIAYLAYYAAVFAGVRYLGRPQSARARTLPAGAAD